MVVVGNNNNFNSSSNYFVIIEDIPGQLNGFEPLNGMTMSEETKKAKK
jgi:hypothetical protein